MQTSNTPARALAVALSALAGFVDALGYIALGGVFVSFMSGNSTELAVGVIEGRPGAWLAGALIASFFLGVVLGSLIGQWAGRRRLAILTLVTVFLAGSALLNEAGQVRIAGLALALAMGAENNVFERDGEVSIGLTYMTGTLVKFGQRLAAALTGGDPLAWAPHLLLWIGLFIGASSGALLYPALGLRALWIAAASAAFLTACVAWSERHARRPAVTVTRRM